MSPALISLERSRFHAELVRSGTLSLDVNGVASNADGSQAYSIAVAQHVANALRVPAGGKKFAGQSLGRQFEASVEAFLQNTFPFLTTLRPGRWRIMNVGGSRGVYHLARFEPYTHLDDLARAVENDPVLASALGNSYNISPDVLVVRDPEPDSSINEFAELVDGTSALHTPIRAENQGEGIVHAVVSCKWTLRSDRAQNARSEALGVIRNRKGRTPHIGVVTAEPSPSRLASLALGTGDLDTVYHIALQELVAATVAQNNSEALQMLRTLVDGKRLRDISDLPLDLAV